MSTERERDFASYYDDRIEEMLLDAGDVDPVDAVEFAEVAHCVNVERRRPQGRPRVVLPLTVQRVLVRTALGIDESEDIPAVELVVQGLGLPLLIQSARRNMRKGRKRDGRPPEWYVLKRLKEDPIIEAEERQRELHEQHEIPIPEAKKRAAKEASDTLAGYRIGINITADSIMKKMRRRF